MDLHVKFTGLCLFVPDPEDATRTHVLMPTSHMDKHTVKLQYAGGPSNSVIDKAWVDLSVKGQTGDGAALPDAVIQVGGIVDRKIKKEQRNKKNVHSSLTAGFTLPRIGSVVPGDTATWTLSGDGVPTGPFTLTHQVTWTISGIDESTLVLTHHVNGSEVPLPRPRATGNEIHINIEHLPADANYCLQNGEEARHFHMYLDVFRPKPTKKPRLWLQDGPGCTGRVKDPEGSEKDDSGSAFNCVVGQSGGGT